LEIVNNVLAQPLWGVLTGLVGFLVGQRFNLWRDKRKEFNERSEDLFISLVKHIEGTSNGTHVDAKTRMLIEPYISLLKRKGFRKTIENYNAARNYIDGTYDPVTGNGLSLNESKFKNYRSCARKLLCYLKRR